MAEAVRVAEAVQLAEVEEVGMAVVEAVVVEAELEPEAVMEAKLVAEGVFMRALGLPVATRVMVMEEEMVGVVSGVVVGLAGLAVSRPLVGDREGEEVREGMEEPVAPLAAMEGVGG